MKSVLRIGKKGEISVIAKIILYMVVALAIIVGLIMAFGPWVDKVFGW